MDSHHLLAVFRGTSKNKRFVLWLAYLYTDLQKEGGEL